MGIVLGMGMGIGIGIVPLSNKWRMLEWQSFKIMPANELCLK